MKGAMRLLHVSDTHGTFPDLPGQDGLVVHTGDLLPNKTRGVLAVERHYQTSWLRRKLSRFKRWLAGRPFVYVAGNHDFIAPTEMLAASGVVAFDATHRCVEVGGLVFYGFPCVPFITGEWSHELDDAGLAERTRELAAILVERPVDVLLLHAPPAGILDGLGGHFGSEPMATLLARPDMKLPRAILCGHVHEAAGLTVLQGTSTLVSQAATTVHSLLLPPCTSPSAPSSPASEVSS